MRGDDLVHHQIGAGEDLVHRASFKLEITLQVAAPFGIDQRRAVSRFDGGGKHVDVHRELCVVDDNEGRGVFRLLGRCRQHKGHRFAKENHLVDRHRMPMRHIESVHLHRGRDGLPARQRVTAGDHFHHAGRGLRAAHVDIHDPRVGAGSAHHHEMQIGRR